MEKPTSVVLMVTMMQGINSIKIESPLMRYSPRENLEQ